MLVVIAEIYAVSFAVLAMIGALGGFDREGRS